ncbi:hypothetical protein VNO78_22622 [Psophocarpus tetragonolobus]|uniref:Uncharacterized protein n=1 Tax=Psophocarpus tetragonolobus TaxID=3891 RepID=A0AAN9S570_PSOTE
MKKVTLGCDHIFKSPQNPAPSPTLAKSSYPMTSSSNAISLACRFNFLIILILACNKCLESLRTYVPPTKPDLVGQTSASRKLLILTVYLAHVMLVRVKVQGMWSGEGKF